MSTSRRSLAEKKFAKLNKKRKQAPPSQRSIEERVIREKTAKLRALRLEKEAAEKAVGKATGKSRSR